MTLKTTVAIGKPYPVREVFNVCRDMLNTPDDVPILHEIPALPWGNEEILRHPAGVGLDAWLLVYYSRSSYIEHACSDICKDRGCDPDPDDPRGNGWSSILVTFDTAYSYQGPQGESCTQFLAGLVAGLVAGLGVWLDDRGLPWQWQDEYTGEWHSRYDKLGEFVGAHHDSGADYWFRHLIIPMISSSLIR